MIEALLDAGASVAAPDDERTAVDSTAGYTPLHAAAFRGNLPAVAILLARGAAVNAREARYCATPAGWANYAGHPEARDLILAGPIDLFQAVTEFDLPDRIPEILARDPGALERRFGEIARCGEKAADWGRGGWLTPLAAAGVTGRAAAVGILLARGADPAVTAPDGRPLAEVAESLGEAAIAAELRRRTG